MKLKTLIFLCSAVCITSTAIAEKPHDNGSNVLWTAVFENPTPRTAAVSQQYCDSHTPTVIVTNINQITSESGITAQNGINIRYLSYKSSTIDDLHFNIVNGVLSGKDYSGKTWKYEIKLYEQTLEEIGKTYTVWSTPYCKGIFTGYPTIIPTSR